MTAALHLAALTATFAGAICLYLGAPRQQWLTRPWPARGSRAGGLALLLLGWLVWCVPLHPATAFFVVLTMGMAALLVLPIAAALTASRRRVPS